MTTTRIAQGHVLETVLISDNDIDYMHAVNPRYKNTFSSNATVVWPTDTRGRHAYADRRVLLDPTEALVHAHELILAKSPIGGRFKFEFYDGHRAGVLVACDGGVILGVLRHVDLDDATWDFR